MSNHNDNFDDELLSAYVDGELTAGERAAVEERLRSDPQAAELVEELRMLSSVIKALPREPLGRDLRASILAELGATHAGEHRQVIPLSEPLDPPRGFRRGFIWSTIAIAATLMMMFIEQQRQEGERDVAVIAKDDATDAKAHTARSNRRRAMSAQGELPPMGEMRSVEPAEAAKPAADIEGDEGFAGAAASPSATAAPERQIDPVEAFAAMAPSPDAEEPASAGDDVRIVELEVRPADGVAHFRRLLIENNFQVPGPQQTDAASSEMSLPAERLARDGEARRYYDHSHSRKAATDAGGVQVVVEGTPAQVERLVDSYRQAPEVFAEVAAPEALVRGNGANPRDAVLSGASRAVPAAPRQLAEHFEEAESAVGSPASYGLAWFLTPIEAADAELGADVTPRIESAPAQAAGRPAMQPEPAKLAKQLSHPPAAGRIRVKFVLRPGPQPADASPPVSAEP